MKKLILFVTALLMALVLSGQFLLRITMKISAFFKCKLHLKMRYHEVLKYSLIFTILFMFIVIFTMIISCREKDESTPPISNYDLLISTIWGEVNHCGTIYKPETHTQIFSAGGKYLEYNETYQIVTYGSWSLTDDENLIMGTYKYKILTLNESLLEIRNIYFCIFTFQALNQTKASTFGVTALSTTSAELHGFVRTCYVTNALFEYGTSTQYGTIATPDISSLTGPSYNMVNVTLYGLIPETVYHYRIKATNATGTYYGQDQTFRTMGL